VPIGQQRGNHERHHSEKDEDQVGRHSRPVQGDDERPVGELGAASVPITIPGGVQQLQHAGWEQTSTHKWTIQNRQVSTTVNRVSLLTPPM
jgi:hypothetical protein